MAGPSGRIAKSTSRRSPVMGTQCPASSRARSACNLALRHYNAQAVGETAPIGSVWPKTQRRARDGSFDRTAVWRPGNSGWCRRCLPRHAAVARHGPEVQITPVAGRREHADVSISLMRPPAPKRDRRIQRQCRRSPKSAGLFLQPSPRRYRRIGQGEIYPAGVVAPVRRRPEEGTPVGRRSC